MDYRRYQNCIKKLKDLNHEIERAATKYQGLAATYEKLQDDVKAACYREAAETLAELFDPEIKNVL